MAVNRITDMTQTDLMTLIEQIVDQRLADRLIRDHAALDLREFTWEAIREQYPHCWVLIEAVNPYTDVEHGKKTYHSAYASD